MLILSQAVPFCYQTDGRNLFTLLKKRQISRLHVNRHDTLVSMIPDDIRKQVGRGGEEVAAQFLERKGYKIIERNYRKKWGEIDVIAERDGVVHFVEVKAVSRESKDYRPEELIHGGKLRKVARTAALYMEQHRDGREFQIDGIAVIMDMDTRTARCRFYEQVM